MKTKPGYMYGVYIERLRQSLDELKHVQDAVQFIELNAWSQQLLRMSLVKIVEEHKRLLDAMVAEYSK